MNGWTYYELVGAALILFGFSMAANFYYTRYMLIHYPPTETPALACRMHGKGALNWRGTMEQWRGKGVCDDLPG